MGLIDFHNIDKLEMYILWENVYKWNLNDSYTMYDMMTLKNA